MRAFCRSPAIASTLLHARFMRNHSRFGMAKGAELLGRQGDFLKMQVSTPLDDEGFLGRQCPDCSLITGVLAARTDGPGFRIRCDSG